jgi:FkbM family methyltransferase
MNKDKTKTFFSQQGEDLLIYRNFINLPTKDGTFLELGACDGLIYSNTAFFEKYLGFSGVLIEPVKEFYDKLIKNRPNNICYNNAISSNKSDVDILVNGAVSGIKQHMTKDFIDGWHSKSDIRKVKTKTLSSIFQEKDIKFIDFFSLDVEGGELDVLNAIDWDNISIYLICIEIDGHNEEKNKKCQQILIDNGFIFKVKMTINEFWINPNYFRKNILFDSSKSEKFTGNMNDYGNHVCLEPHCKPNIEKTIYEFENK